MQVPGDFRVHKNLYIGFLSSPPPPSAPPSMPLDNFALKMAYLKV
jgi:hypothetical protein